MKLHILLLTGIAMLALVACASQVTNFEECVAAGNPVMESYPEKCAHNGETFTRVLSDDNPKPCTKEYMPVCGEVEVQCVTAPCNPVKTTFANKCLAENEKATILYEGECQDESTPEGACLSFDGNWIEEANECEGMAQEQCESLGGTFNACASSCRNLEDPGFCTMQCVVVCSFE